MLSKWFWKLIFTCISLKLWIMAATFYLTYTKCISDYTFVIVVAIVILGREGIRVVELLKK